MVYFKIDLLNVLRKKSTIITFITIMLIIFAGNFGMYKLDVFGNIMESGNTEYIKAFPLFMGYNIILSAAGYTSFALGSIAITDEIKERGYIRVLESGKKRESIIITKFFEMFVVCLIFFTVGVLFHSVLNYFLFGWDNYNTELLLKFLTLMALALLPILVILLITFTMYFIFKTELFSVLGAIFVSFFSNKLVYIVGHFLKINALKEVTSYFPGPTLSEISSVFSGYYSAPTQFNTTLSDMLTVLRPNIIFNLLFLIVIILLSITIVKRKDFD